MVTDRQSNPLSGATPAAAARFDDAVRSFTIYRGDPIGTLDQAVAEAPAFAQAHLFKAFILGLATEPQATRDALAIAETVRGLPKDDREASQLAALDHLLAGGWVAAAGALDFHNMRYPRDLVALAAGHLMDFYRGNARDLRDRIARALPHWNASVPGHHAVLGMYAFGLEEAGDYARAEQAGREALDLEPLDSWAHHAVTHVMEMQGRAEDGIGWMIAREPYWSGDDNFFKVHNWWHRGLFHLDLGQVDQVLALYDGPIRGTRSRVALDLVDASALLWRVHLAGHDVGDRWAELADCWDDHADGRLYPFNDLHAVMASLGAGRRASVDRVVAAARAHAEGSSDTARWAGTVGLPLIAGFVAFWDGRYADAVQALHPVRFVAHQFGGSHAQRDVIDWTLTEAALRAELPGVALGLASERTALKPHSPVNRGFLQRAGRLATV